MRVVDLNERLVADIVRTARMDPDALRFKFYAREMEYVLHTKLLSDGVRAALSAGIADEREIGHSPRVAS